MRKTTSLAGTMLATALLLGACGSNPNADNNGTENTSTTTDSGMTNGTDTSDSTTTGSGSSVTLGDDGTSMKQNMDELDYAEFELEVDYGKNKEYELEIEQDNGIVEAKLEDELNNVNLKGQEAFDEIYPRLKKLTISKDTSKEDAIQQALDVFDLEKDYVKFDMEITFQDNTKASFEDGK
ncbi:hypothetical protein PB01_04035 [Psychrobacillus glaciei]|uniref:YusW-like protein n=1 Tax=Psychrobacillus glaciei TaxID=2283160 RepID=A0A5J6SK49_9BACI|nr:YusW family protein [Psychrobacillus glaciei]QFF98052.1 hypothetical protein PB01_04035 [Psychrobacillus glaciei]